jgi:hypothetical protein
VKRLRSIATWTVAMPFILAVAFMEARNDAREEREAVRRARADVRARQEARRWSGW